MMVNVIIILYIKIRDEHGKLSYIFDVSEG